MKILAAVFFIITMVTSAFFLSINTVKTIRITESEEVATKINSIYYIDNDNGWACGDSGLLLKTANSGTIWEIQNWTYSGDIGCRLNDIKFVDLDNGWMCGCATITDEMYGVILHTSDGGKSWELQTTWKKGWIYELCCIEFTDDIHGWCGGDRVLLCTVDSGTTWEIALQEELGSGCVFDVMFIDGNYGWFTDSERIWYTMDGGYEWYGSNCIGSLICSVDFPNLENGWAISSLGNIFKSETGGGTWYVQNSISGEALMDIDFINETHGWIVGTGGKVYYTTDGGLSYNIDETFASAIDFRGIFVQLDGHVNVVGGVWQTGFGESNVALATIVKSEHSWTIQLAPTMTWQAGDYIVTMQADSTLTQFSYNAETNEIKFTVFGPTGYSGQCNVTIPKDLVKTPIFDVYKDGVKLNSTATEDQNNYYIRIEYTHTIHKMQIKFATHEGNIGGISGGVVPKIYKGDN